jgi:hypothetical protein
MCDGGQLGGNTAGLHQDCADALHAMDDTSVTLQANLGVSGT